MDDKIQMTLATMQNIFKELLSGKQCEPMEEPSQILELQNLSKLINKLIQNMNEMNRLTIDLSQGKLDGPLPSRYNYMASPLKQLHSQLSILKWNMCQLQSGYVVSKLEYTGELFDAFNGLIDQVVAASTQERNSVVSDIPSFNSWRYHQILQALNMLHILVLEIDSNGRVMYANHSAKEILGEMEYISSECRKSKVLEVIKRFSSEDYTFPALQEIYENGSRTWYQITSDRILLPNGQILYIHMIENVNEWKIKENQLILSSMKDTLTSAYNRKTGLEELENLLAHRDPRKTHCISFIDIDSLKTINDTYGHNEGDYTIKNIAKVLLSTVRDSDIVCRFGGDEFFIIFKNCSEEAANKIIMRTYEILDNMNNSNRKPYMLSFSYGIVPFSSDSTYKATDLLELADQKMYQYKNKKLKT
ncbi:sensor domain-containing diguanylate cyclase [Lachnoclostridium phytofermentans]|uniref:Diguanylate cyclase with PAS/PAC sensor n=1 Tax=Lachnoclostridium phytofermentans (strain ATCC 700394 / DSM 18823 / ISDg) TaxID=357809 RepID=A9KQR3_LACP7|nr:GGDEF domain-containing protein [Lachnoclostridium phytofermentans]ABX41976.1 diguanylate cyclase with PAS/PAC sensor [Lachnoclostridium phytofermentans ISDg]